MGKKTGIQWTDATFNPWWGCTAISPGCDHCYAETHAHRFGTEWGAGAPRREFGDKHWNEPLLWNEAAKRDGVRRRVFCASMADVFDKDAPEGARARLFALIEQTPHLDWLLLTKRIGNVAKMAPVSWMGGPVQHGPDPANVHGGWPANVWLGATIVNQEEADRDIPKLLAVPARVRFLSMEPLLGKVYLPFFYRHMAEGGGGPALAPAAKNLHWVIVGGESGSEARPMHPAWALALRDQCRRAGVAFFFKQWGTWAPSDVMDHTFGQLETGRCAIIDEHGARQTGLRKGGAVFANVGKYKAGRLLDGVEHNAFPVPA